MSKVVIDVIVFLLRREIARMRDDITQVGVKDYMYANNMLGRLECHKENMPC